MDVAGMRVGVHGVMALGMAVLGAACLALLALSLLSACLVPLVVGWLRDRPRMFDADEVSRLARQFSGLEPGIAFQRVATELLRSHPGHILPEEQRHWVLFPGRASAHCLLHASLTEQLQLSGTALDTIAQSGRHWANVSATLVSGTVRQWKEGTMTGEVFYAGDTVWRASGEATAEQWVAGTWMVEYSHGFIPLLLLTSFAENLLTSNDLHSMFYMLRAYIRALHLESLSALQDAGFA
uniref:Sigma non-opioid intracellular receptor 1 n=1 Tax=Eptatretus burgeri TaxID=7764 RepID=A0A8C4Q414_EPTBU